MLRRTLSILSVLALSLSSTTAAALAGNPTLQAWRETGITSKCEWLVDNFNPKDPMVRLTSYAPLVPAQHVVAVVPNFGKDGAMLNNFSFELKFNSQTHVNVRPGVNVEYDDGSGKLQYLHLGWNDYHREDRPGDRIRITYDIKAKQGKALKVMRIAIGGRETWIKGRVLHGIAVPDFTIARFVAEDASSNKLSNDYSMEVGDRNNLMDSDPIFSGLSIQPNNKAGE